MNMVFAFCGSDTRLQGSVLRLRKKNADPRADTFAPAPIQDSFLFLRDVVRPRAACCCRMCADESDGPRAASSSICARELLVLGELVHVEAEFLEELHGACLPLRPPERKHRVLDTGVCYGWLLPDLCHIPPSLLSAPSRLTAPAQAQHRLLSIEIKPKSCILPRADCVRSENAVKASVSRFRQVWTALLLRLRWALMCKQPARMMQVTKLKAGTISHVSRYDPLHLFSSDLVQVTMALARLLDHPQNNLEIRSLDARGADGDEGCALGQVEPVTLTRRSRAQQDQYLADALGLSYRDGAGAASGSASGGAAGSEYGAAGVGETALCQIVAELLAHCGVLGCIKSLQALDAWDIENIAAMHAIVAEGGGAGRCGSEQEVLSRDGEATARALRRAAGGAELPDESLWAACIDDFLLAQVLAVPPPCSAACGPASMRLPAASSGLRVGTPGVCAPQATSHEP